jgi:hypothetical protein
MAKNINIKTIYIRDENLEAYTELVNKADFVNKCLKNWAFVSACLENKEKISKTLSKYNNYKPKSKE